MLVASGANPGGRRSWNFRRSCNWGVEILVPSSWFLGGAYKGGRLSSISNGHWFNHHAFGFPGGSVLYNPPDDIGDKGSIPGVGNDNPSSILANKNSMDRGTWWAAVHWVTELEMIEEPVRAFAMKVPENPKITGFYKLLGSWKWRWKEHGTLRKNVEAHAFSTLLALCIFHLVLLALHLSW